MAEAAGAKNPVRTPSVIDALIPVAALILSLATSYVLYGDKAAQGPNQIALLFSALIAAGIAVKNGMSWDGIRSATVDGVATGLSAIFILLAVGALIGTWALSGTIVTMVYYGLQVLSPHYFYASAALICAVVAVGIGSSWTVAGTIGIGLIGVADNMGLSPAITAGAIISGAYFGDKASPLSDTVNLATAAAGSDLFTHIRETLWTSIPALVLAVICFALLGRPGDFDASALLSGLSQHFVITPWALLPLVLVFGLAVVRFPPFVTIFAGALFGGILAALINPNQTIAFAQDRSLVAPIALLKGVWSALATGYVSQTGEPQIDLLLSRGGMESMLNTVWLILTALAFGAVLEHAGLLNRLIEPIVSRVRSTGALAVAVVASCLGLNIIASDQYIAIVLPARMFRVEFERRGLPAFALSRAVGDSGSVTSPLIPWNSCGAYMAASLGVPTLAYAGFAFFCLFNPLATILIACFGFRVHRAALTSVDAPPQLVSDAAAPTPDKIVIKE
jgi:Na+:H+ antiporter, NhaC family